MIDGPYCTFANVFAFHIIILATRVEMFVGSVVFVGSFLLPLGCWVSAKKWLQLLVYNISKKSYSNAKTIINGMVEKTGTGYRIDGYRIDGYRIDGYRIDGYRIDGYRIDGYRIDGYRIDGYHYTRNLELIRKTAIFSTCLGA